MTTPTTSCPSCTNAGPAAEEAHTGQIGATGQIVATDPASTR